MKTICCFLIVTLVAICHGFSPAEELIPNKLDPWMTYDETVQTLKEAELQELLVDAEEMYNHADNMAKYIYELVVKSINQLLMSLETVLDLFSSTETCVNDRFPEGEESFRAKFDEMKTLVSQHPKTVTCYTYLHSWMEDIKKNANDALNNYISGDLLKSKGDIEQVKNVLDNARDDIPSMEAVEQEITKDPKLQEGMDEFNAKISQHFKNYVNALMKLKAGDTSMETMKQFSHSQVEMFIKGIDDVKVNVTEEVRNEIERAEATMTEALNGLRELDNWCDRTVNSMHTDKLLMETFTRMDLSSIEKMANADIFHSINNETVEPLKCDEYIPYFGMKPSEMFSSVNSINDDVEMHLAGINDENQYYKRFYVKKSIEEKKDYVHEIMELVDQKEFLDREYIIDYSRYVDETEYYELN